MILPHSNIKTSTRERLIMMISQQLQGEKKKIRLVAQQLKEQPES